MPSSIISPTSPLLPNLTALIALFPTATGAAALLRPQIGASVFETTLPTDPAARKLVRALFRLYGIRDVFLGAATLTAWWLGDRRTLGYLTLLGTGVVLVDGVVQKEINGGGREWKHWGFVPVTAGLGASLLGLVDGMW